MRNNRVSIFIGLIFLVVITSITTLLFSGLGNLVFTGAISGYTSEELAFVKKIMDSKKVLMDKFYADVSEDELFDGAMAGMFSAVNDPYTEYLPEEASSALEEVATGKYEGVGIVVSILNGEEYPTILYTLPDSPAEKAELKENDKILSINGTDCKNLDLDKAVELMKIKAGSELNLKIKRDQEEFELKLKTEEITISSVYSEKIDDIGYIQITSFDEQTSKEFITAYEKLREENIKGLLLDLRDNGGGIFEEVVKIANVLVPKGLIVYTEDKNGKREEEKSTGEGIDIPLVVLVNENSASASEILAGAIKDRKCGTLVGKKTYGKGVVQGWFIIGDGTSIKLTIAKYFTPNGVCIDGVGIEPDIEVEEGNYFSDLQMKKALEILKNSEG